VNENWSRVVLVEEGPDTGLVWHAGNPLGEQRSMQSGRGILNLGGLSRRASQWSGPVPRSGCDLVWAGKTVFVPDAVATRESLVGSGNEWLVPSQSVTQNIRDWGDPVGVWAFDALRIEAGIPLSGFSGVLNRLYFDGEEAELPPSGSEIILYGNSVGTLESATQHCDDGPIGLAVLNQELPPHTLVYVAEANAATEPVHRIPPHHPWRFHAG
jgi:hypothetical protein